MYLIKSGGCVWLHICEACLFLVGNLTSSVLVLIWMLAVSQTTGEKEVFLTLRAS